MNQKPKQMIGIPDQKEGSFHDTESRKNFDNAEDTTKSFNILKTRFLSINQWKEFCGDKSADFKLYDSLGNYITRSPQEKDFIRIDIPGSGNPESNGYDWVKIIKISNQFLNVGEMENVTMICVPSKIPGQDKNDHIAHFYSEKSSSTFRIARGSKYIKIGVHGRNEIPNYNTGFLGKIRNLSTAVGGMLGFSKIEWKIFTDGLIDF